MDGPEKRAVKSIFDYWQLILVAIGGIVGAITFYNNVNTIVSDQKAFRATVEDRRTKTRDEIEAIRLQSAIQKNDIDWLKELRRENVSRDHVKP